MTKHKLPNYVGWYQPHDRSSDYTGELVNHKTGEVYRPPSMTKQSFVAECDIKNILKNYQMTGQIAHMSANAAQGAYRDLPEPTDYQEALNTVIRGEAAFASLPSGIRSRFENDPEKFLIFCADPANQDEMIKLGLAKRIVPEAPEPPAAPVEPVVPKP